MSFRACTFINWKFDEFAVTNSDAEVITQVSFGGEDNFDEGMKLLRIASCTKGNLESEFNEIIGKAKRLSDFLKSDAMRLGLKRVVFHNDVSVPNFIATEKHDLILSTGSM